MNQNECSVLDPKFPNGQEAVKSWTPYNMQPREALKPSTVHSHTCGHHMSPPREFLDKIIYSAFTRYINIDMTSLCSIQWPLTSALCRDSVAIAISSYHGICITNGHSLDCTRLTPNLSNRRSLPILATKLEIQRSFKCGPCSWSSLYWCYHQVLIWRSRIQWPLCRLLQLIGCSGVAAAIRVGDSR